jgi:hypothetical protein
MTQRLHGIMAEFGTPEALVDAVKAAKRAGFTRLDAYSPFPLSDLAEELGIRTTIVDYPLNVGGRPLDSWPAFIPSTLIVAILWAGAATLIGLLLVLRLPRLHHPVFAVHGFERASQDRFFFCILSDDPLFESGATRSFLEALSPQIVREVPACD